MKGFRFLVTAILFLGIGSSAMAQVNLPTYAGQNRVDAGAFQNDSLLGCQVFRVEKSTTPAVIVSAPAILERLCAFGGSGGNSSDAGFAVALDSNSALGNGVISGIPSGEVLAQPVQALNLSASAVNRENAGCADSPDAPAQAIHGIVVALSSNTISAVGCFRLQSGTNP
ncbi:MAG: hypothetical protein KGJ13_04705 [Patescibacteria group bacterium]|nr:hypothetical protein [Patescibacteria group bacterium]